MKLLHKCLAFGVVAVAMTACSDENPWLNSNGEGGIAPKVTTDPTVVSTLPAASRATETIEIPDAAQFGLSLVTSDGQFVGEWDKVGDFPVDEGFETGSYTLTAFYGDIEAEGYDAPYFEGSTDFTVQPGDVAEVSVEARLANSMVTVTYTDAFKAYFSTFKTTLHSEGYGDVELDPARPDDAVFVGPSGKVTVTIDFEKLNGKAAKVQPAQFAALPNHHYYIELNVNKETAGLEVNFNDDIDETHDVLIDISDVVLDQPAPTISPEGFASAEPVAVLEQNIPDSKLRFNIFAGAGIAEAVLKIESESISTVFLGSEFDICNLSDAQKTELDALGVKVIGLMGNTSQLAYVDVSEVAKHLTPGVHTFTLTVKDKMTRLSQPCVLSIDCTPITLLFKSAEPNPYGADEAIIYLDYNGTNPEQDITIQAKGGTGVYVDCPIKSIEEVASAPAGRKGVRRYVPTRAASDFPMKTYRVIVTLPEVTESHIIPVQIAYKGVVKDSEGKVELSEYSTETSAFATKAYIKVSAAVSELAGVVANLDIKANGAAVNVVSRDAATGMIIINGLNPSTQYNLLFTSASGEQQAATITTEAATALPNGGFESLETAYSVTDQNQGGTYTATNLNSAQALQNHQTYTIKSPTGWVTNNAKTMSGSPDNSWFRTFSVYNTSLSFVSNMASIKVMGVTGGGKSETPDHYKSANLPAKSGSNAMVIRNVGWSSNGTVPGRDQKTGNTSFSNYYCSKLPGGVVSSIGKLFLGSYSYSGGTETLTEGLAFASRPTALTGYYKYANDSQDAGEYGVARINVIGANGKVIGTGTANLTSASDYTQFTANITYNDYFTKAAKIQVMFASSNHAKDSDVKVTQHCSTFVQEAYGAMLTIDDVQLKY